MGALALSASSEATALAQPAAPAPSEAPAVESPPDRTAEAAVHFEKGRKLSQEGAWAAALEEFLQSRQLSPRWSNTIGAASCLDQLLRHDEALELFEALLRDFASSRSAKEKADVESKVAELGKLVGSVEVQGAEAGATIIIDGRYRGNAPLPGPVRVVKGRHEVRAYKEGADPFGATVEVAGGQNTVAALQSQSRGGRLRVSERRGRALDVVVDGSVVGKTPWEGPMAVGDHLVLLRGNLDLDALPECAPAEGGAAPEKRAFARLRGKVALGTLPASVPVRLHELTPLTLTAEELETSMRVEPTPAGASVAIDSVVVGRGAWEGLLRVGTHTVEVSAEGFLPEKRVLSLERRKPQVVKIALGRDGRSPLRAKPVSLLPVGVGYSVGAAGLGVFAVTGALSLRKNSDARSRCRGNVCLEGEKENVDTAETLGDVSTVGLVVGLAGVAVGTLFAVELLGDKEPRPGAAGWRRPPASRVDWRAGVGLGRLEIEGRF